GDYLDDASPHPPADLLVANAFLDLVDVPSVLPRLFRRLAPEGLYWFPINYDGETILQPEHPDDRAFLEVYDSTIDDRIRYGRAAGDSATGRHLFGHLASAGATILASGASDWVVHGQGGRYEADEEFFLHCIFDIIEDALQRRKEIEQQKLVRWMDLRRGQIARGELVYIAHQLDFVGRRRAPIAR